MSLWQPGVWKSDVLDTKKEEEICVPSILVAP